MAAEHRSATSILGDCPNCGAIVTRAGLLAIYEVEDEWPQMLAACAGCDEIVEPV